MKIFQKSAADSVFFSSFHSHGLLITFFKTSAVTVERTLTGDFHLSHFFGNTIVEEENSNC